MLTNIQLNDCKNVGDKRDIHIIEELKAFVGMVVKHARTQKSLRDEMGQPVANVSRVYALKND